MAKRTRYSTPPWRIEPVYDFPTLKYIVDARGSRVAETGNRNASLIAASPEMLTALQAVADYWDGGPYYNKPDEVEALFRAAIAKAAAKFDINSSHDRMAI